MVDRAQLQLLSLLSQWQLYHEARTPKTWFIAMRKESKLWCFQVWPFTGFSWLLVSKLYFSFHFFFLNYLSKFSRRTQNYIFSNPQPWQSSHKNFSNILHSLLVFLNRDIQNHEWQASKLKELLLQVNRCLEQMFPLSEANTSRFS